ncbi:hypothetical protein OB919_20860 [Halobacteria archaeon AArc-curdl1]|uniref:Uncharacterized protein n=1 Tax=Natronosalvus hydrolyticus TaxID=2979988 RepID=A0AAP3E8Y6_9EURY|nr:hypothetical protein [Halobacteria archaeon AArc-curdl1]
MTSIRDLVSGSLGVGERFCLEVELEPAADGQARGNRRLLAAHPYPASPVPIAVTENLETLEEIPPTGPIEVEVVGPVVNGAVVGRVVSVNCSDPEA